jgi:hypothetical protein
MEEGNVFHEVANIMGIVAFFLNQSIESLTLQFCGEHNILKSACAK